MRKGLPEPDPEMSGCARQTGPALLQVEAAHQAAGNHGSSPSRRCSQEIPGSPLRPAAASASSGSASKSSLRRFLR